MKMNLAQDESSRPPHQSWLICLVLTVVTFFLYSPVTSYNFTNYDDSTYITLNPMVQKGVNPHTIKWAFTTGHASNWHPLTWLSHMIDFDLYGLTNPGGHHLTNILLHIASTLLLFIFLRQLTGKPWRSAVVAALFAWHPAHVESVAWIAERKDVLCGVFWFLTLIAYLRYVRESQALNPKGKNYYYLTLFLFALGLMSKPMVITLPCVLLLLDYWPLERMNLRPASTSESSDASARLPFGALFKEKLPFFALVFLSSVITFYVQRKGGAMVAMGASSISHRIGNSFLAYVSYLRELFWPFKLAVFYPNASVLDPSHVIAAVVLLALLTLLALAVVRMRPYFLIGWLWFLGTLVPVIGLIQVGSQSMADRYTYLPSVGIFIAVVWALGDLFGGTKADRFKLGWIIIAPALIACVILTSQQLPVWKNSIILFQHALAVAPDNVVIRINLGEALDGANQLDEAKKQFLAAVALEPDAPGTATNTARPYNYSLGNHPAYRDAHYNLGNVYAREKRFDDAAEQYEVALRIAASLHSDADSAAAHNNYGAVLMQLGRTDEALANFKEALRLSPHDELTRKNFDRATEEVAHRHAAKSEFLSNLSLNSGQAGADSPAEELPSASEYALAGVTNGGNSRFDQANQLMRSSNYTAAAAQYQEALKDEPNSPAVHKNLGIALTHLGQFPEAVDQFEATAKLQPDSAEAQDQLAGSFLKIDRPDQAQIHYTEAVRLKPSFTHAQFQLGLVLAEQGMLETALAHFNLAAKQEPTNADTQFHLATTYAALKRYDEAAKAYGEVLRLKPNDAETQVRQALNLALAKKYPEAIVAYRDTLRLKPDSLQALQGLAWILATNPDASLRNGAEALKLAQQADQSTKHTEPIVLSTLDAAYAETGQFDQAIKIAEEVQQLSQAPNQKKIAEKAAQRLELYRAGKPFHDEGKP